MSHDPSARATDQGEIMRYLPCLLLLCLLMSACAESEEPPPQSVPVTDEAIALSGPMNRFTLDLYRQCAAGQSGNIFISPYSVNVALTMAWAGAQGDTAYHMYQALRWPMDDQFNRPAYGPDLHRHFGHLNQHMQSIGDGKSVTLHLASALWPAKGEPLDAVYTDRLLQHYGVTITPVIYPQPGCDTINRWVERQTEKRIRELVKPDMLDPDLTRLVLTNAIYFKGDWEHPFKKKHTRQADFHLDAERKVSVDMMHQSEEEFGYARAEGFAALELPYRGGALSMVILLPDKVAGLSALEESLTADQLKTTLAAMRKTKLPVAAPKFWMTWEQSLNEPLKAMGMERAFDSERADFSGINGKRNLFIALVQHKAYIEVNEEGAEAAAATGVVEEKAAEPMNQFIADHPFLFLIRDTESGAILFIGRMVDPSG